MLSFIWHTFAYDPIYNALVFLVSVVPHGDVGVAVILLTILVKLVLFPLSIKAVRTQMVMQALEPKLAELKEKYKEKREELSRRTLELYKEAGANPLSGVLLMFIQIPIIIALYLVVRSGLPELHTQYLYAFTPIPKAISLSFLGLFSVLSKDIFVALVAGAAQFAQGFWAAPIAPVKKPEGKASFQDDFARTMQFQTRYFIPILIGIVAYSSSAVVGLYFITSSLFAIGQELYVRKHVRTTPKV